MLHFEKMTVKAQEAVQRSQEIAASHENQAVEPSAFACRFDPTTRRRGSVAADQAGNSHRNLSQEVEREIARLPACRALRNRI